MNRSIYYNIVRLSLLLTFFLTICCANGGKKDVSQKLGNIAAKEQIDSLVLIFSGDLMQHEAQLASAKTGDNTFDYSPIFLSIREQWEQADHVIVNLETTLSEKPPYSGYPQFCSSSSLLDYMKLAGVTTLAIANNHLLDKGGIGITNTIKAIEDRNFEYIGVSDTTIRKNIIYFTKGALKTALLNYTYGTNGITTPKGKVINRIDTLLIKSDYNEAVKSGANRVVVFYHWGDEYQLTPNKSQKELALWSRNLGIDIVIGSHPHVLQPIDRKNRIIYSLGNLCSNQSLPYTQGGASARITIYNNGCIKLDYFTHWVDLNNKYRIRCERDTTEFKDPVFIKSINDSHKIIETKVIY